MSWENRSVSQLEVDGKSTCVVVLIPKCCSSYHHLQTLSLIFKHVRLGQTDIIIDLQAQSSRGNGSASELETDGKCVNVLIPKCFSFCYHLQTLLLSGSKKTAKLLLESKKESLYMLSQNGAVTWDWNLSAIKIAI